MKEYLENNISKRMESLNRDAKIIQSLIAGSKLEGKVSPLDLSALLNCYRDLVAVTT